MKKMFFAAAFLTAATVGTTFAQDATSADNNTAAVEQVVVEFVDVDIDTLPAAVMEAVATIDREAASPRHKPRSRMAPRSTS